MAALAARWLVGGLFIYMGLNKAMQPVEFLKLVRQYEMVESPLVLNVIAATLPWFEVVCGLCLVAGVAIRGAAVVSLAMLVPFTLVVLRRALAIQGVEGIPFCAVRFDCGCGAGVVAICHKLVENGFLVLLSGFLVATRRHRWAIRPALGRSAAEA